MKAKTILEVLDFDRSQTNPLKKLGIGISYRKWREDHDGKILFTYFFYLLDPFENKKTYWVHLYYSTKNEYEKVDTVYFDGERLIGGWSKFSGTPFAISNMQNKPANRRFNKDETTFWKDPQYFNKDIIDQLSDSKKAKKWFDKMTQEWFENSFEQMMRRWFNSGTYQVDHSELKFRG